MKDKIVTFHCTNCGNEVKVSLLKYSGSYDILCKDCEKEYKYEETPQPEIKEDKK